MNEDILKVLEGISYVATLGVLVVAIFGLRQISVTRKIARNSSKREALTLASKQVEVYLDKTVKKADALYTESKKKNLRVFKESTFKISEDNIIVDLKPTELKAIDEMLSVMKELLDYLNAMEAFSTYFTSKLADEGLAYKSVGRTFCSSVKMYMPAIVTFGTNEHFQNILEIYRTWQDRMDEEDLLSSKKEIEKKLVTINSKKIVPLGADTKD